MKYLGTFRQYLGSDEVNIEHIFFYCLLGKVPKFEALNDEPLKSYRKKRRGQEGEEGFLKGLLLGWLMMNQIESKNLGHQGGVSSSYGKCHTAVR